MSFYYLIISMTVNKKIVFCNFARKNQISSTENHLSRMANSCFNPCHYKQLPTHLLNRGKFTVLEDTSCRIKPGCTEHPPWPGGICTKCQPSAITLKRQVRFSGAIGCILHVSYIALYVSYIACVLYLQSNRNCILHVS